MSDDFLSPRQLLASMDQQYGEVPNDRLFNDPKYQKFREQWAAGQLGTVLETLGLAVGVRVLHEQESETDFELLMQKKVIGFQFSEAQKPGRRRGVEYKERKKKPPQLTPHEPQRGTQEGPSWVANAVRDKVRKNYDVPPHLLVYANFEADDLDANDIRDRCCAYRSEFPSLWVLQNHRVIQLWESSDTQGWARKWVPLSSEGTR